MSKGKYAKEPLLFIHQEKLSIPRAPMQERYVSKRKKRSPKMEEEVKAEEQIFHSKKKEDELSEEGEAAPKRKQFKDMTIQERIDHFVNMSPYAPKMKCEVKTAKKSYRGLIMDLKENVVYVQTGRRMNQVELEEIEDIELIGF